MYCTLSVICFTALFKDGEQNVGLSVTVPVLNGLEERLVLWEMATCDRSCGGKSVGKTVSALVLLKICGWTGTGRLSGATFI